MNMETQNIAQSMAAPAADEPSVLHESTKDWLKRILFSFQGRIERFSFWAASVVMGVVGLIAFGVIALIGLTGDPTLVIIAYIVFAIPILYVGLSVQIKRLRDLGISGWVVVLAFVPFVNFVYGLAALICLGFIRGTIGENKYGIDPDPTILCPECGRRNLIDTWHCDCGHSF
jgi:uncharacterized membrane protein YhaH (DUF805 family)